MNRFLVISSTKVLFQVAFFADFLKTSLSEMAALAIVNVDSIGDVMLWPPVLLLVLLLYSTQYNQRHLSHVSFSFQCPS